MRISDWSSDVCSSDLHPDLVGKTLLEADVRARCNVHVVGVWERGSYRSAGPETLIRPGTVLILAGSMEQLVAYDDAYARETSSQSPGVVIGAGRGGRDAGKDLAAAEVPDRTIEPRDRQSDVEGTGVSVPDWRGWSSDSNKKKTR